MNIKKLFSIPGRMRLYIEGLKRNSNAAINVENLLKKFSSIDLIKINLTTGTILLTYNSYYIDEDMICKIISSSSIELNNLSNTNFSKDKIMLYSKELFPYTKSLSKRLLALSICAASILLFTASPIYAISSLVLGFPGVLYLNSYFLHKYILINADLKNIYIKDINSVIYLKDIKDVLIHENIIFNNDNLENLKSMNYFRIESLIHTNRISDPIQLEARHLIKDLRYMGINNITVISENENNGLISYANKSLGLYDTQKAQGNKLIIIKENDLNKISDINDSIILSISPYKEYYEGDINIACHELYQISWLINQCRINQEHLVRAQAVAVSINVFGIFLVMSKYITLGGSILLYLLNTLGNLFYIKQKTLNTKKILMRSYYYGQ